METKNTKLYGVNGKEIRLGNADFVLGHVDEKGVLSKLYKVNSPYKNYFTLYQRYPNNIEKLTDLLPDVAKKIALDLDISAKKYLEVFEDVKPINEGEMRRYGDPLSVKGYSFQFEKGYVAIVWEGFDTDAPQYTYDLEFYYKYRGDDNGWHFSHGVEVEGSASVNKQALYEEALALVESGYLLSGTAPEDEDTDW